MNENLLYDPLLNALDPSACTVVGGREIVHDPGLALLRRYLPVLVVIAAPYAGVGGESDPPHPLDPVEEWRVQLRMLAATEHLQSDVSTRLALVRLVPPTAGDLRWPRLRRFPAGRMRSAPCISSRTAIRMRSCWKMRTDIPSRCGMRS
jgi:hypothetical protein